MAVSFLAASCGGDSEELAELKDQVAALTEKLEEATTTVAPTTSTTTTTTLLPNPAGFRIPQEDVIDRQHEWVSFDEFTIRARNSSPMGQYYRMAVIFELEALYSPGWPYSRRLWVEYCTVNPVQAGFEGLLNLYLNLRRTGASDISDDVVLLVHYIDTYGWKSSGLTNSWTVDSFTKSFRNTEGCITRS